MFREESGTQESLLMANQKSQKVQWRNLKIMRKHRNWSQIREVESSVKICNMW